MIRSHRGAGLLLPLFLLGAGLGRCDAPDSADYYQVTNSSVELRARPANDAKSLARLKRDRLLKRNVATASTTNESNAQPATADDAWIEVETLSGKKGFVFHSPLTPAFEKVQIADLAFWERKRENPLAQDCELYDEECLSTPTTEARDLLWDRLGNKIQFNQNGFAVTTDPGGEIVFTNRSNGFDTRLYRPLYAFNNLPFLLIQVSLYEGGSYLLLNLNSGDRLTLWDLPRPDQEERLLVVTSAAIAKRPNGIQIVELSETGARLVFERKLDWFPASPRWISKGEIEVDRYRNIIPPDIIDGAMTRNKARLKKKNGTWDLSSDLDLE